MYFWIVLILVSLTADYFYRKKTNEKAANIPGPSYHIPLFGHRAALVRTMEGMFRLFANEMSRYGKTFSMWCFHEFLLVTTDAKVLDAVLNNTKHIRKPRFYNPFRPWLGDCALLSVGEKWKLIRKKVFSPVFHFSAFDDFIRIFDEQSSIFVECVREHCGKGAFDIHPYVSLLALDVIAETGLDLKMNTQTTKNAEYVHALHGMTSLATKRMSQPILSFDFTFQILAPHLKKKQDEYIKTIHSFAHKSILDGRKNLLQRDPAHRNPFIADKTEKKHRYNIIDYLLNAVLNGEHLSNDGIRENIDALFFAGHDTATTVITFTLYCLSRHPEAQEKVFKEIREAIGDDLSKPVGLKELNELKYLECVMKEAMRLYPPGTIIGREIEEDIDVDNLTIPAGTTCLIPIKHVHSNPEVFPEPAKFIPERFAFEAEFDKQHPYSFLTFSAGPRDCAGRKFAMLEVKSILSKIIRHYELLAMGEEPNIKWDVLLNSTNGVNMGLKPRVYN